MNLWEHSDRDLYSGCSDHTISNSRTMRQTVHVNTTEKLLLREPYTTPSKLYSEHGYGARVRVHSRPIAAPNKSPSDYPQMMTLALQPQYTTSAPPHLYTDVDPNVAPRDFQVFIVAGFSVPLQRRISALCPVSAASIGERSVLLTRHQFNPSEVCCLECVAKCIRSTSATPNVSTQHFIEILNYR
jgi:hypothetical protein